jgi:hypothetical protein
VKGPYSDLPLCMTSYRYGSDEILSPAAAGSGHFHAATPPSSRKKRGTQTGLKLCLPYGPLAGNEPVIFFWK